MITIIESPWKCIPDAPRYLAWCLRDQLDRGNSPIASHALYPLALSESDEDRARGLTAFEALLGELRLYNVAYARVWYMDLGETTGMKVAWESRHAGRLYYAQKRFRLWLPPKSEAAFLAGEWPSLGRLLPNFEIPGGAP